MEKNDIDIVISPTAIKEVPPLVDDKFRAARKMNNPVYEFKMDYFTAFPNTLGIPSMTLPIQERWVTVDGERKPFNRFPSSVKICTYFGEDYHLLRIARQLEMMIQDADMWPVDPPKWRTNTLANL